MSTPPPKLPPLEVHPLTPDRWPDLEALFGPKGACAGCWCMGWRLSRAQFVAGKGEKNKKAMKAIVESGEIPGLIAYAQGRPVGWIAIARRERYVRLAKARTLKPLDDQPVWSVTCFFVAKDFRRRGVTVDLLRAAKAFAAKRGATILEGYPSDPRGKALPDPFVYTGLPGAFEKAGFEEAARPAPTRPIMRKRIRSAGA
jgi:GNAT superfamily N-acetyltransferase